MSRKTIVVVSSIGVIVAAGVVALVLANREPFGVGGYAAMCDESRGFEEAAAVSGAGPHPAYLVHYGVEPEPAEEAVWSPDDPATVQLVVCAEQTGNGEHVERCEYTPENNPNGSTVYTIDLYKGIWDVSVYAASTGEELGVHEVHGEQFVGSMSDPEARCQSFLNVDIANTEDTTSQNYGRPSAEQLRSVLDAYVL